MNNINEQYLAYLRETVNYGDRGPRQRVRERTIQAFETVATPTCKNELIGNEFTRTLDDYPKIWIWSDQHFGHKNIIKYSDRPYEDLTEMNGRLIDNHNKVVAPNDIVIWGGDIAFLPDSKANEILDRLNGYKILVIGNHDVQKNKIKNLNVDEMHLTFEFSYNDIDYIVSHYPATELARDKIHLYGHTHNRIDDQLNEPHMINICVENNEYAPISMDRINEMARSRILEIEG